MRNFVPLWIFVFALSLLLGVQGETSPPAESDTQKKEKGPVQFRAAVDQVVVYASVYDAQGQLVSDLTEEDFSIFEDKVQQSITYFGQDDVPSTIGLIMDASGSMRDKWDLVNEGTKLFLSLNNPQNEMFLIKFDDEAVLEENFTRDIYDIQDAMDNIIVGGGTALYDAIYLGVEKAAKGSEPRKALVVFTDGEDKDSYYKQEELVKLVQESDVQVHIIAFLDPELEDDGGFFGVFKSEKEKIQKGIQEVADFTGGKALFPEKVSELKTAFESIARELSSQYRLAYVSSNSEMDGSWRRLDVNVKDAKERGLKVRAKRGYHAHASASGR